MCINESLFPLTPLSISILYSSTETFLPLSHSPKFPNPNPKLKPEFQVTKSHSFSTLSPFLRSGRILARGGGQRACAVVAPAAASGGCSLRRLQPAAAAAAAVAAAAAASGSSLLLLPARHGRDRRAAPATGGAGDDITRGEGVAFISDFSSNSNFKFLDYYSVLFMKIL